MAYRAISASYRSFPECYANVHARGGSMQGGSKESIDALLNHIREAKRMMYSLSTKTHKDILFLELSSYYFSRYFIR